MSRIPEAHELDTLQAIDDLHALGWSSLDKFDPRRCLEAGWIVQHNGGYRLTGTGREALHTYRRHKTNAVPNVANKP